MATSNREQLYFDAIKEHRGAYFVEYQPPVGNNPFATLNVVYPETFELSAVSETMRTEMVRWLRRYPVPVMVTAFNASEDIIRPNGSSDDAFLVGWLIPGTVEIASTWKSNEVPAFVNDTASIPDWRPIYKDVPFRTEGEIKSGAQKYIQQTRYQNITLKIILTLWVAVVPATWATIQYFGPEWLAFAVFSFALWRAFQAWRKLTGRAKPSRSEEEKSERQRKMDHYYYHCELNPEGFARLKIENFEKDISARTRKEAEELAKK